MSDKSIKRPLKCWIRIHEWSRVMRIGGPRIRMCRRCYVVKEVGA